MNFRQFGQLTVRLNSLLSCRRKYEIALLFNKHERKTISIWNTSLCVYVSVAIICNVRDESLWIFQIKRRERRRIIEIVLESFPVAYIRLCVCVCRQVNIMTCSEDKMNKVVGTSKRENSDHLIFPKLHDAYVKQQQIWACASSAWC